MGVKQWCLVADLKQVIEDAAAGPAKASGKAGAVEQHKLADLIAADKHLSAKTGLATSTMGIRRMQMEPPATA